MEQGIELNGATQPTNESPEQQLDSSNEIAVVTNQPKFPSSEVDLVGLSGNGNDIHGASHADATAAGDTAQQTFIAQGSNSQTTARQPLATNYVDPMGRPQHVSTLDNREWYVNPHDAKLVSLCVQSAMDHQKDAANWDWVLVKDKTPLAAKLNMFVWESKPHRIATRKTEDVENTEETTTGSGPNTPAQQSSLSVSNDPNSLLTLSFPRDPTLQICMRWAFATIVILPLLLDPRPIEGRLDNNGFYDPVRYRDWGYTRSARNPQENDESEEARATKPQFDYISDVNLEEKVEEILGSPKELEKHKEGHFDLQQEKEARGDHLDDRSYNLPSRHLRPRLLCFRSDYVPDTRRPGQALKDSTTYSTSVTPSTAGPSSVGLSSAGQSTAEQQSYSVQSPEDWIRRHGQDASTEYVFVSYSRQQFTVDTDERITEWWKVPNKEHYSGQELRDIKDQAKTDRDHIIKHGERAARAAGVPAFWIDFLCLPPGQKLSYKLSPTSNGNNEWIEDVYRICDVSRAAHSMIIVLGPPNILRDGEGPEHISLGNLSFSTEDDKTKTKWLRQWGKRLWTLPELLLCPTEHRIAIYYLDSNGSKPEKLGSPLHGEPEKLAKRNFAIRAYEDGKVVRELVDHYEGSLILTPLELVTKAFECLWRRDTNLSKPGDQSYALMGLLRRRPDVNYRDSAFEAFARLSLANDSNLLLERLICMLPKKLGQQWHVMLDAWDVNLWDVEPNCQVAGIVDHRTVLLDGAFGATIQWHALKRIGFVKRRNIWREAAKFGLRFTPGWFIIGVATVATLPKNSHSVNPTVGIGAFFLAVTLILILTSPYLFLSLYKGKFWSTQACFFGIEGPIELSDVEKMLFGFNHGRLRWSTNGSMLSQHKLNKKTKICVPLPPKDTGVGNEHGRLFTLIDTYTMTATRFRAERPPVAVLICGREGGMQRAVLCSYNWRTNTLCRETVLRMKTIILERMFRVDRFRFALSRDVFPEGQDSQASTPGYYLGADAAKARKDQTEVE